MMTVLLNYIFLKMLTILLIVIQCEKEYHVGCLQDIGLCELEVSTRPLANIFMILALVSNFLLSYLTAGAAQG